VKIIEVDAERRRLSLSLKRIEDGAQPQPLAGGDEPLRPQIDLSEEVFADAPAEPEALDPEASAEEPSGPGDAPPPTTESAATDETAPIPTDESAEPQA
jgi:hypothetical protein